MGVHNLWKILDPVKEPVKLETLRGQTLAVDLSVWICDAQGVKQMQGVVAKPHLRNLFFRLSHLLQLGIGLIFVVDGEAPELKWEAMMMRQQARFGHAGVKNGGKPTKKPGRSHFRRLINECCQMLDYLGVPYVQSVGEAEAFCALLNKLGFADSVITQDGDAFLYGATRVYKNFSISGKDAQIESYSIEHMNAKLHLNRDKLIALGLLLGCDYVPKGVPGVGKETAMKFMMAYTETTSVLERFREWRADPSSKTDSAIEGKLKSKALGVKEFPFEKVIDEFMVVKDKCPKKALTWRKPQIDKLYDFNEKMDWPRAYTNEKIIPLLTLHDMRSRRKNHNHTPEPKPERIIKARVRQFVPCFEVRWEKLECDTDPENTAEFYATFEEKDIFTECYPELVTAFEETNKKNAKGKKKKRTTKKKAVVVNPDLELYDVTENAVDNLKLSDLTLADSDKVVEELECLAAKTCVVPSEKNVPHLEKNARRATRNSRDNLAVSQSRDALASSSTTRCSTLKGQSREMIQTGSAASVPYSRENSRANFVVSQSRDALASASTSTLKGRPQELNQNGAAADVSYSSENSRTRASWNLNLALNSNRPGSSSTYTSNKEVLQKKFESDSIECDLFSLRGSSSLDSDADDDEPADLVTRLRRLRIQSEPPPTVSRKDTKTNGADDDAFEKSHSNSCMRHTKSGSIAPLVCAGQNRTSLGINFQQSFNDSSLVIESDKFQEGRPESDTLASYSCVTGSCPVDGDRILDRNDQSGTSFRSLNDSVLLKESDRLVFDQPESYLAVTQCFGDSSMLSETQLFGGAKGPEAKGGRALELDEDEMLGGKGRDTLYLYQPELYQTIDQCFGDPSMLSETQLYGNAKGPEAKGGRALNRDEKIERKGSDALYIYQPELYQTIDQCFGDSSMLSETQLFGATGVARVAADSTLVRAEKRFENVEGELRTDSRSNGNMEGRGHDGESLEDKDTQLYDEPGSEALEDRGTQLYDEPSSVSLEDRGTQLYDEPSSVSLEDRGTQLYDEPSSVSLEDRGTQLYDSLGGTENRNNSSCHLESDLSDEFRSRQVCGHTSITSSLNDKGGARIMKAIQVESPQGLCHLSGTESFNKATVQGESVSIKQEDICNKTSMSSCDTNSRKENSMLMGLPDTRRTGFRSYLRNNVGPSTDKVKQEPEETEYRLGHVGVQKADLGKNDPNFYRYHLDVVNGLKCSKKGCNDGVGTVVKQEPLTPKSVPHPDSPHWARSHHRCGKFDRSIVHDGSYVVIKQEVITPKRVSSAGTVETSRANSGRIVVKKEIVSPNHCSSNATSMGRNPGSNFESCVMKQGVVLPKCSSLSSVRLNSKANPASFLEQEVTSPNRCSRNSSSSNSLADLESCNKQEKVSLKCSSSTSVGLNSQSNTGSCVVKREVTSPYHGSSSSTSLELTSQATSGGLNLKQEPGITTSLNSCSSPPECVTTIKTEKQDVSSGACKVAPIPNYMYHNIIVMKEMDRLQCGVSLLKNLDSIDKTKVKTEPTDPHIEIENSGLLSNSAHLDTIPVDQDLVESQPDVSPTVDCLSSGGAKLVKDLRQSDANSSQEMLSVSDIFSSDSIQKCDSSEKLCESLIEVAHRQIGDTGNVLSESLTVDSLTNSDEPFDSLVSRPTDSLGCCAEKSQTVEKPQIAHCKMNSMSENRSILCSVQKNRTLEKLSGRWKGDLVGPVDRDQQSSRVDATLKSGDLEPMLFDDTVVSCGPGCEEVTGYSADVGPEVCGAEADEDVAGVGHDPSADVGVVTRRGRPKRTKIGKKKKPKKKKTKCSDGHDMNSILRQLATTESCPSSPAALSLQSENDLMELLKAIATPKSSNFPRRLRTVVPTDSQLDDMLGQIGVPSSPAVRDSVADVRHDIDTTPVAMPESTNFPRRSRSVVQTESQLDDMLEQIGASGSPAVHESVPKVRQGVSPVALAQGKLDSACKAARTFCTRIQTPLSGRSSGWALSDRLNVSGTPTFSQTGVNDSLLSKELKDLLREIGTPLLNGRNKENLPFGSRTPVRTPCGDVDACLLMNLVSAWPSGKKQKPAKKGRRKTKRKKVVPLAPLVLNVDEDAVE